MYNIHKNIFSDSEKDEIKNIINNKKKNIINIFTEGKSKPIDVILKNNEAIINEDLGKIYFDIKDLPNHIIDKLLQFAKDYEPNATFHEAVYTEYNVKYGQPKLNVHKDRTDLLILIDYQQDSNTQWDLILEEKQITLENNDALMFFPGSQDHGRVEKIFSENQYVAMIFFYFDRNNV